MKTKKLFLLTSRIISLRVTKPRAHSIFSILLLLIFTGTAQAEINQSKANQLTASTPEWITLTLVGDDLQHNGVDMLVYQLKATQSIAAVLAFYSSAWAKPNAPAPLVTEVGPWQTLSVLERGFLYTVQVQPVSETSARGLLAVTNLPKGSVARTSELPKSPGTELLSVTNTIDQDRSGQTVLLKNTSSVSSNMTFYRGAMKNAGWQLSRKQINANGSEGMLWLTSKGSVCQITFISNGSGITEITAVIANSL